MNKEDYNKFYIQGSDHYLISKDVFDELFDEMENWKEENQELKAELQLYQGALKRENEAIHRANDLEEVIDRIEKYIEKETRIYGLSMSKGLGIHFDNILGILKGGSNE